MPPLTLIYTIILTLKWPESIIFFVEPVKYGFTGIILHLLFFYRQKMPQIS
jgi:hypothetical protein